MTTTDEILLERFAYFAVTHIYAMHMKQYNIGAIFSSFTISSPLKFYVHKLFCHHLQESLTKKFCYKDKNL